MCIRDSVIPYALLLVDPLHFQRLRESRNGELGLFADFGYFFICAFDLAQYASPLLVPGFTLGPPSFALPACP